ncbi:hypothetical protein BDV3_003715 [Batrachochytrium dendrobatidis]|nr:hypothetical protein O5D80_002286 [Batrachochytrium dendrobatidis]KAK5669619.1 hypothetical protein QVD99_004009 [Batrachochytrium dendrobatidis]
MIPLHSQRPLNAKEASYLMQKFTNNIVVCGSVHIERSVFSVSAIQEAFVRASRQLQHEYPLWASTIINTGTNESPNYVFEMNDADQDSMNFTTVLVQQTLNLASKEQLCRICADEVKASPIQLPRIRLLVPSLIESDLLTMDPATLNINRIVVIMTVPHTMADGRSAMEMFRRLLTCAFTTQDPIASELPQTLSDSNLLIVPKNALPLWYIIGIYIYYICFLIWYIHRAHPVTLPRILSSDPSPVLQNHRQLPQDLIAASSHFDILLLDAAESTLLLVASKKLGATVTTLLAFAIAKSIATVTMAPINSNMIGGIATDIRPRLGIPRHINGCFTLGVLIPHRIHQSDFDTLADIGRTIKQRAYGKAQFLSSLFLDKKPRQTIVEAKKKQSDIHLAYAVSSLGLYDAIELGEDVSVHGVFFGTAASPLMGAHVQLHAITFDHCLSVSVSAPEILVGKNDFNACMTVLRQYISKLCQ